jgi:hypothetical protein
VRAAIICFFKGLESLQSAYYIGTVSSLYEELRTTFLFRPNCCSECLPEDLQTSLCARAFTSVFRTRRTGFANLGYEILTRTGETVDWSIRTVEEENCHFNSLNAELNPICHLLALLGAHHIFHVSRIRVKLRKFILTLFYVLFCPK